jgi:hypothetical protein
MKVYRTLFPIGQFAISLLFVACAVALVVIAPATTSGKASGRLATSQ